jgi:two-component system chemotaxis sensor kinase CheA
MSEADVQQEFLAESAELLDQMESDLVALEKGGVASKECLASIFRAIHTIKGTAGFLGYKNLTSVTHTGESLLGGMRNGRIAVTPEIVSTLLSLVDAVRRMLTGIAANEGDAAVDCTTLTENLRRLHGTSMVPGAPPIVLTKSKQAPAIAAAIPQAPPAPLITAPAHAAPEPQPIEPTKSPAPLLAADAPAPAPQAAPAAPALTYEPAPTSIANGPPPSANGGDDSSEAGPVAQEADAAGLVARAIGGTIRVDVGLLEKLMNLVGELVLTRNQLLQFNATREDPGFLATSQRLNLITTELQEGVMKARMQPIGSIWGKYPRVVRDLAIACEKQVKLEMEGAQTELDRTIIEAIKDPLTHLIRNAIDHGLEKPEERVARGKSAQGRVTLRAFHEGGQVNIEIADDGRGIDIEKIRARASRLALITPEVAARMTEREWLNVIFMPGFSTAEAVSNVSGRGVGMDVVRTNVEKIGGTVDVQTRLGVGSSVHLKIPLTLAIIPALIVTTGANRFAIPQVSLLELVHLEPEQARTAIERIHGAPVYRLRGHLLPLIYLGRELHLPPTEGEDTHANGANIVVLQAEGRHFGLVVDEVNDTEEIVVKPLGKQLKSIACFAGATIMGDGRVALILDALGLAQRANLISSTRAKVRAEAERPEEATDKLQTLLLFTGPDDSRMAIPLSRVDRLEEFPISAIEHVGGERVVQYRGDILPLVPVSSIVPERRRSSRSHESVDLFEGREKIQVVVNTAANRPVGLVVSRILDIVQEALTIQARGTREGVLGTAVIQGRVTELVDVEGALNHAVARLSHRPPVEGRA